jgi:uncharacterized cupredoxin-like copper-binding protein
MHRVPRILLVLLAGVSFLAACGDDDDDDAAGTDAEATEEGTESAAPPEVTITATETGDGSYAFEIPDDVPGGVVQLSVVSAEGNAEPHDFQLTQIEEGGSMEELLTQLSSEDAPIPGWIETATGVGTVAPGQTGTAFVELEPNAEYVFFCTEAGDSGGHADHGMTGTFTTGDDSGAELPEASATVTASEYAFDVEGIVAGANTIEFVNDGQMIHHVGFIPIVGDATLDEIKAAFEAEDESAEPPVDFEHAVFSAVAGKGDRIVFDADLAAGRYLLICFMPDLGTAGPPHALKGMFQELTVE